MILNSSDMGSISSSLCFVCDVIVCKLFALQFSDPEIHNDEIGNWCGRGTKERQLVWVMSQFSQDGEVLMFQSDHSTILALLLKLRNRSE